MLVALARVSRLPLQVGSLPHALVGAALAAPSFAALGAVALWVYVAQMFALITFACQVNCLCDVQVDRRYKRYLSDAVERLGRPLLLAAIGVSGVLALAGSAWLWAHGQRAVALIGPAGLALGFAYSAEPLRVKRRGALSFAPVALGLYVLPTFGAWWLVQPRLEPALLVLLFGWSCMNQGITLVNTCEDYREDRAEGVVTLAHTLGLERALWLAPRMTALGGAAVLAAVLLTARSPAVLAAVSAAALAIALVARDVARAGAGPDLQASAKVYARRLGPWFMAARYPLLAAALVAAA